MEEVPLSDRFAKVNPSRNIKQLAQGWPSAEAIQSRHVGMLRMLRSLLVLAPSIISTACCTLATLTACPHCKCDPIGERW